MRDFIVAFLATASSASLVAVSPLVVLRARRLRKATATRLQNLEASVIDLRTHLADSNTYHIIKATALENELHAVEADIASRDLHLRAPRVITPADTERMQAERRTSGRSD